MPAAPNKENNGYEIIIIGGGLAGLTAAIMLSHAGKRILLLEKGVYPSHKVCGEYISNEILPLLKHIGFDPFAHGAMPISRLRISTPSGKNIYPPLGLGGFGLSRYSFDNALSELAIRNGCDILTKRKVTEAVFNDGYFTVRTHTGESFTAALVIGSYGKRDTLDKQLDREFIRERTGYLGVKYHIRTDYPIDEIGLDNFEGGYCGISRVEDDRYNLCYLYRRRHESIYKTIPDIEEHILSKNPVLKKIFSESQFLFDKPEVINDFSFAPKNLIENHILMCGDTAGLITPLCGNGMSMAIHAAKILCDLILKLNISSGGNITAGKRQQLESEYSRLWRENFSTRLFWGRRIQSLFGSAALSEVAIRTLHAFPPVERMLINKTHGLPIEV
ncbi:MAG: FAD-dependent oxidoreductase [Bacteroidetes bacterium]|nr:FAD-dependent oxidoreductase [Bacteroidota bacterium]